MLNALWRPKIRERATTPNQINVLGLVFANATSNFYLFLLLQNIPFVQLLTLKSLLTDGFFHWVFIHIGANFKNFSLVEEGKYNYLYLMGT